MNEFEKLQHQKLIEQQQKKCVTCAGILNLPKPKIKQVYEAFLDHSISGPVISDVLNSWGIAASTSTIQNHRRGRDSYAAHMAKIKKAAGIE